tara:strand:+ start:1026 stop:1748 length:723 start_codon:yes stop_codon:yes gene_type:complete
MKLIFENWRKYIKEETRTAPAKRGARRKTPEEEKGLRQKQKRFSLPADLMPTLFEVLVGDPETFSLIHKKYNLDELKEKDYEEVKYDKKYDELLEEMLYEPIKVLRAIGHYGNIKKEHYKDFFDFVLKLPEEKRVHVLTALAIYSDKWTRADIIGLLAYATEQIKLYGCLFHERNPASFKATASDYHHCRGNCEKKCKAEKDECIKRGEDPESCEQKEGRCKNECQEANAIKDIPIVVDS